MVSTTKAPSPISVINKLIRLYFTQDIANPGLAVETVTTVCSSKRVLYYERRQVSMSDLPQFPSLSNRAVIACIPSFFLFP